MISTGMDFGLSGQRAHAPVSCQQQYVAVVRVMCFMAAEYVSDRKVNWSLNVMRGFNADKKHWLQESRTCVCL